MHLQFTCWPLGSDVEGSLVIVTVAYSIRSLVFVPQFVFVFCTLPVWKWVSEDGVGGGIGEAGTCCSRGARNSLRYKTGARPLPDLNGQVGLQHFLPLKVSSYSGLSFPHIFGKLAFCHLAMVNIWEFLRKWKEPYLLCLKGAFLIYDNCKQSFLRKWKENPWQTSSVHYQSPIFKKKLSTRFLLWCKWYWGLGNNDKKEIKRFG